jgi:hypothetical protein
MSSDSSAEPNPKTLIENTGASWLSTSGPVRSHRQRG